MKINLTKKQYESLVKIVYLGNWMANSIHNGTKEDPGLKEYNKIEQYIFSFAKDFGFKGIEKYNNKPEYGPTRKFEESKELEEIREKYDEENFWEELLYRLADRDFEKKYSREEIKKMEMLELFEKQEEFRGKWGREFEKYGIDRLNIENNLAGKN